MSFLKDERGQGATDIFNIFTSQTFGIPSILFIIIIFVLAFLLWKYIWWSMLTRYQVAAAPYMEPNAKAALQWYTYGKKVQEKQLEMIDSQRLWYITGRKMQEIQLEQMKERKIKEELENHTKKAGTYYQKGEFDLAVVEYKKALKLDPEDPILNQYLGMTYYRQGLPDKAIKEYAKSLNIEPNNSNVHNNLGLALENQDKIDRALEEYKEALRINPNHENARNNLNRLQESK